MEVLNNSELKKKKKMKNESSGQRNVEHNMNIERKLNSGGTPQKRKKQKNIKGIAGQEDNSNVLKSIDYDSEEESITPKKRKEENLSGVNNKVFKSKLNTSTTFTSPMKQKCINDKTKNTPNSEKRKLPKAKLQMKKSPANKSKLFSTPMIEVPLDDENNQLLNKSTKKSPKKKSLHSEGFTLDNHMEFSSSEELGNGNTPKAKLQMKKSPANKSKFFSTPMIEVPLDDKNNQLLNKSTNNSSKKKITKGKVRSILKNYVDDTILRSSEDESVGKEELLLNQSEDNILLDDESNGLSQKKKKKKVNEQQSTSLKNKKVLLKQSKNNLNSSNGLSTKSATPTKTNLKNINENTLDNSKSFLNRSLDVFMSSNDEDNEQNVEIASNSSNKNKSNEQKSNGDKLVSTTEEVGKVGNSLDEDNNINKESNNSSIKQSTPTASAKSNNNSKKDYLENDNLDEQYVANDVDAVKQKTQTSLQYEDYDLFKKSDDEDDMPSTSKPKKKRKKGLIYISNLPKHMNVTRIREILGQYGEIGRVYLQPEKLPGGDDKKKKKKRKPFARHFTEGWVEFESKRIAKQVVEFLNNKQISIRKSSQFYDHLWCMKYLTGFKWMHLTERMNYERMVYQQRLRTEVSQARKEMNFFQSNLDKSEYMKRQNKKNKKSEGS